MSIQRTTWYAMEEPRSKLCLFIQEICQRVKPMSVEEFVRISQTIRNFNPSLLVRGHKPNCCVTAIIQTGNAPLWSYLLETYPELQLLSTVFFTQTPLQMILANEKLAFSQQKALTKITLDFHPEIVNLITPHDTWTPLTLFYQGARKRVVHDDVGENSSKEFVEMLHWLIQCGAKFNHVDYLFPTLTWNIDLWWKKFVPHIRSLLGGYIPEKNISKIILDYAIDWFSSVCVLDNITSNTRRTGHLKSFQGSNNTFYKFLCQVQEMDLHLLHSQ